MRAALPFLSVTLLLGACAGLSGKGRPDGPVPQVAGADGGWIDGAPAGPMAAGWWQALGDPQLDGLIAQGLAASPDVAEAEAKLRSARAALAATRARALPQLDASGSATTNAQSANGMIPFGRLSQFPGITRSYDLFDAGFDASWEIDIWGARAAATRAAAARGDMAAAQRDGVRLTLAAEIARTYTQMRADQARRANWEGQEAALAALATLQQARLAAGEATRDEALAATQRLESARAQLAGARGDATADAYALAQLTGQPPEALAGLIGTAAPLPAAPAVALVGLRSDVLARRPDVRGAVADLAAAHADVKAARAALFPSLSLTGSVGQQARTTGTFTAADSTRYSLGPSLHWPVFAGGQLRAQLRGARADADAAAARYGKAVLTALADSETAANRLARAADASAAAASAASAAEATGALADARFIQGEDSRAQALEARLAALSADNAAISARAAHTAAYVALGKALGAR
ncbi:MAG TPA: efflux transporter outer membrane subunit [Novosphingobium sp.]|nr:efflux transporter outer membrane subunit [Novosphingobium sp.]